MAQQSDFKGMTDEHIPNAVVKELQKRGVAAVRLIDVLAEGTPDPEVLDYCHQQNYTLITADEHMTIHIKTRIESGKEHTGVFIIKQGIGSKLIGAIVEEISFYDAAIKAGAASVENDVYNQVKYIRVE